MFPGVGNNSVGVLSTGDLTLASGSRLGLNINGTTAGTTYDQIAVAGTVTLGATSSLQLTAGAGFTPTNGLSFTILTNEGEDTIAVEALNIAGDVCIYTNRNVVVEEL